MENIINLKKNLPLLLLFVVFAIHVGKHVNDFYVPDSDFFDFRDKAISLRNGEWPENFKRPPLFSAAIALVSTFIPGHSRELYAAELLVFLSALLSLVFVAKIAGFFLGKNSHWAVWLWAFHPTTIRMVVKPKSEIFVTLLILAGFWLFIKKRKWAYFLGFLASTVRYEGALIIAAVGGADFLTRSQKLKTIAYSLAAGAFIVIWTFSGLSGADSGYLDYFSNDRLALSFIPAFLHGLFNFLPSLLFYPITLAAIACCLLGAVHLLLKHTRESIALLILILGFFVMHFIWPSPNHDYLVIVSWIVFIFMLAGIVQSIAWVKLKIMNYIKFPVAKFETIILVAQLMLFTGLAIYIILHPPKYPQLHVSLFSIVLPLASLIALCFVNKAGRPTSFFLIGTFLLLTYFLQMKTNDELYNIRYAKAEFRLVGEWLNDKLAPDEKIVVSQPTVVSFYSSIDKKYFISPVDIPELPPNELNRWLVQRKVKYVAWLSTDRIFKTDNIWYQWKMENRGWKSIDFLKDGTTFPGFEFVTKLEAGPRYAFLYRLTDPENVSKAATENQQ